MLLIANMLLVGMLQAEGPALATVRVLWQDPADLENRNLLYGSGGKKDAPPAGPYRFLEEDLQGSNPKFIVEDSNGAKWKVKLGAEAKSETVATRLLWAMGYFADEDYFVERAELTDIPRAKLRRLKNLISSDATIVNARFERQGKKKSDDVDQKDVWSWKKSTFAGTRELNGLRVLMSTLNNWDLKDENNSIHVRSNDETAEQRYTVSDLGASFGTTNLVKGPEKSRGNLKSYEHSRFITRTTADHVDFASPGRPTWLAIVNLKQYFMRLRLEQLGRNIPRADAKWMGAMLARLSPDQIRDAFRSAAYSPADVERFAQVLEGRIAQLNAL